MPLSFVKRTSSAHVSGLTASCENRQERAPRGRDRRVEARPVDSRHRKRKAQYHGHADHPKTRPSLIEALPIDLLNTVLSSIDDARAFLCAAASCKAIQALERESRDEQWRRLTLLSWPAAGSHGLMAKMTWKARYKYCFHKTDPCRPVERGAQLTATQLNERFEFFIQLGSCPHAWDEPVEDEKPWSCVALHMELDAKGCLVPVVTPDDAPPEVLLHDDGDFGIEITVRRVADGAVATLMEGFAHATAYGSSLETDEGTTRWEFVGDSQFERMYSLPRNQGALLGFDRMSFSHRNSWEADYMSCLFVVLPEMDAQDAEEIDMTKPARIECAQIEIAGDSNGEVLEVNDWSLLLTGRHLVRWDLYE